MRGRPGTVTWSRRRLAVAGALAVLLLMAISGGHALVAQAQAQRVITLAAPAAGQVVTSPVAVRGRVTVGPFENTLRGTVYDATDRVVGQGPVMVTPDVSGQLGGPGTFTGQLSFSGAAAGRGRVEVADVSPRDGSILASAGVMVVLAGPAGRPAGPGSTPTVLPRPGLTSATVVLLSTGLVALLGLAGLALVRRQRTP
jgi:Immunoglobulin-like domain of bacterial spore germination